MKSTALLPLMVFLAAGAALPVTHAQVQITALAYGTMVDSADNAQGGLTFREQYTPVNTVSTATTTYRFDGPTASSIVVRRNTSETTPNNTTVFYQNAGTTAPLGQYENSIQNMFLSANLTEGLRNPFANRDTSGATNAAQLTNIERIDFNLPNYVVKANDSLVFFDLENAGNFGDGFRIAAFTSVGTVNGFTNAPTVYAGNGLLVATNAFGAAMNSPTGGTAGTFQRSTYTNGDSLTGTPSTTDIGNGGTGLNLVGILIRFSDLGIAAGTTIQGFSLMGGDVTPTATTGADLVNWNTTTVFRTDTNVAGTGYGNMDFMAFGATVARPVPEPSTYGAIFVGLGLCVWLWRRRPQPVLVRVKV